MTTEYRDPTGKLLRTDAGTRPRGAATPVTPAPPPLPATAAATDTSAAKKEK